MSLKHLRLKPIEVFVIAVVLLAIVGLFATVLHDRSGIVQRRDREAAECAVVRALVREHGVRISNWHSWYLHASSSPIVKDSLVSSFASGTALADSCLSVIVNDSTASVTYRHTEVTPGDTVHVIESFGSATYRKYLGVWRR